MGLKKYLNRKTILTYLYDQLTGNLMGFLVGMSATKLVSQFFETRSFKNLWGITSKKTVVDKSTFANLEWIISILIGFIVFEIMTKVVKARIDQYGPAFKRRALRWAILNDIPGKATWLKIAVVSRRAELISTVHVAVKNTITKYSKR
ncbi:hypothetical protein WBG78_20645 [Chryseolinea sp. T2]|uniref:hypothetical protein n=1 Tax=Chryseolinea sp. T2 TaxID=3129255 RepID=UPI00307774DB